MSYYAGSTSGHYPPSGSTSGRPTPTGGAEYTFADLDTFLKTDLQKLRVDELKAAIEAMNQFAPYHLRLLKSGLKQELRDRIAGELQKCKANHDLPGYRIVRNAIASSQRQGANVHSHSYEYTSGSGAGANPTVRSNPTAPSSYGGPTRSPARYSYPGSNNVNAHTATSSIAHRPNGTGSASTHYVMANWKSTPMWRPIRALSDMVQLPPIDEGSGEKKTKALYFVLPQDVINALVNQGYPRRSVRVFCTSSEYYPVSARNTTSGLPIDYPVNPDIVINNHRIDFRKGLKGKANTAAPANLEPSGRSTISKVANLRQHVMFGQSGPSLNKVTKVAKRFYVQICLTEDFTPAQVQAKILSGRRKTKEEVLAALKASAAEDEIEVGSAKMSLRCPLSYVRITTPIRADTCSHLQCCELSSWVEVNGQTPQFACPSCEKEMSIETIFIDEYFQAIVKACPDTIDEVIVEPDGEWHSEDGKFHSAGWNPPPSKSGTPAVGSATPISGMLGGGQHGRLESRHSKGQEVDSDDDIMIIDDSDDEDKNSPYATGGESSPLSLSIGSSSLAAGTSSPGARPSTAARSASISGEGCIDLTGDSDDEDVPTSDPPRFTYPPAAAGESMGKRDRSPSHDEDGEFLAFKPAAAPPAVVPPAKRLRLFHSGSGSGFQQPPRIPAPLRSNVAGFAPYAGNSSRPNGFSPVSVPATVSAPAMATRPSLSPSPVTALTPAVATVSPPAPVPASALAPAPGPAPAPALALAPAPARVIVSAPDPASLPPQAIVPVPHKVPSSAPFQTLASAPTPVIAPASAATPTADHPASGRNAAPVRSPYAHVPSPGPAPSDHGSALPPAPTHTRDPAQALPLASAFTRTPSAPSTTPDMAPRPPALAQTPSAPVPDAYPRALPTSDSAPAPARKPGPVSSTTPALARASSDSHSAATPVLAIARTHVPAPAPTSAPVQAPTPTLVPRAPGTVRAPSASVPASASAPVSALAQALPVSVTAPPPARTPAPALVTVSTPAPASSAPVQAPAPVPSRSPAPIHTETLPCPPSRQSKDNSNAAESSFSLATDSLRSPSSSLSSLGSSPSVNHRQYSSHSPNFWDLGPDMDQYLRTPLTHDPPVRSPLGAISSAEASHSAPLPETSVSPNADSGTVDASRSTWGTQLADVPAEAVIQTTPTTSSFPISPFPPPAPSSTPPFPPQSLASPPPRSQPDIYAALKNLEWSNPGNVRPAASAPWPPPSHQP